MKILSIVGARPNFMKIAPFINAIGEYNLTSNNAIDHKLIHTGQHYDKKMSKSFFEELNIPLADINLGIGSGTHAEQVGKTMIALEKIFIEEEPDWIVVVGDVNATIAASVTAKKCWIKCCHIEAGLRSGDMKMPEEVNRLVTDRLSDLLLTPDKISTQNLLKEGVDKSRIRFVGNIMIDTLEQNREKASKLDIGSIIKKNHLYGNSEISEEFSIATLHRPSNVDDQEVFKSIFMFLTEEVPNDLHLIWPVHPRALKRLEQNGLISGLNTRTKVTLLKPLSYYDMLRLNMSARVMLTDSGGLQEECTVLGTPCLTLRWNTERPVTLKEFGGASVLVGNNIERIRREFKSAIGQKRIPEIPELWDGNTAERCLNAIISFQS